MPSVNLKLSASDLPDRDEYLEKVVLSLILNEGHRAIGVLRTADIRNVTLRIDLDHFSSAVHRVVFGRILKALATSAHHGLCLDPVVIRSQLMDDGDGEAADEMIGISGVPARMENARLYADRLEELKRRRDERREAAKVEVRAREVGR